MALVDNVTQIAFATPLEVDKIFSQKFGGSFTAAAAGALGFPKVTTYSLSNPYGVNVLPVMIYTIDGTNWYDGNRSIPYTPSPLNTSFSAACYTTSSNIVVVATNWETTSRNCQFKIALISDD